MSRSRDAFGPRGPRPSAKAPAGRGWALRCACLALAVAAVGLAAAQNRNGFDLAGALVDPSQILRGGPPRDGIPAIDNPVFVPADEAGLSEGDRVIGVAIGGDARAYPVRILNWHEIVNDTVGGRPVAVTFCPLCGTGMVFSSEVSGQALGFGVSGLLYNSDVLLYDRETESLWSQILAQAVTGEHKGRRLEVVPTRMTTWSDWRARHPGTAVLSEETGHRRDYSRDPYAGYADSPDVFFPLAHRAPAGRHPKEEVLGVIVDGVSKAYPESELEKSGSPVVDTVGGRVLTVHWDAEARSGNVTDAEGGGFPFIQGFWFAWYAFHPGTAVYRGR